MQIKLILLLSCSWLKPHLVSKEPRIVLLQMWLLSIYDRSRLFDDLADAHNIWVFRLRSDFERWVRNTNVACLSSQWSLLLLFCREFANLDTSKSILNDFSRLLKLGISWPILVVGCNRTYGDVLPIHLHCFHVSLNWTGYYSSSYLDSFSRILQVLQFSRIQRGIKGSPLVHIA